MKVIFSCEHAGAKVPKKYKPLFRTRKWLLTTHRASDPGAYEVASSICRKLRVPLSSCKHTRLLIDVNRTLRQESLFSVISKGLNSDEKSKIIERYYWPYRNRLAHRIKKHTRLQVLHISIHSFTPIKSGLIRKCDIGLLFKVTDPVARFNAQRIRENLLKLYPKLNVRFNFPYKANSGGIMEAIAENLTDYQRKNYSGLYIEINQKLTKYKSKFISELLYEAIRSLK